MAADEEVSIKGPIAKLALQRASEAVRHVSGKKPKPVEAAAVRKLVDSGTYSWCRFAPKRHWHDEGDLDRWQVGAAGGADYVEFLAPPREALSMMRQLAQAAANPAKPPRALVSRLMKAINAKRRSEVEALAPAAARGALDGRSPLFEAMGRNWPEGVKALAAHTDLNALEERSGQTPLIYSLQTHYWSEMTRMLLPLSDLSVRTSSGRTALMEAAARDGGWVTAFIEGSDPMAVDERGWSALMHAAAALSQSAVKALLPLSDPSLKDIQGRDALALALGGDDSSPRPSGRQDASWCVDLLLPTGDLSWRDEDGDALPAILAKRGLGRLLDRIEGKCDLGAAEDGRDTPLIIATRSQSVSTIETLLPSSKIDARGVGGQTALMVAASLRSPELVRLLLPLSNPDVQDDEGKTALMVALESVPEPSYRESGGAEAMRCALALMPRSDPSVRDKNGFTALMHAIAPARLELFELLLPRSDPNAQTEDGSTALMLCESRSVGLAFAAALVGVSDLSLRDREGRTALMRHASSGSMVRRLIPGSEVDARDGKGRTALMHAASRKPWQATSIELLLEVADARLVDDEGKSAAMMAREEGEEEIATLIEAAAMAREVPKTTRTAAQAEADRKKRRERDL